MHRRVRKINIGLLSVLVLCLSSCRKSNWVSIDPTDARTLIIGVENLPKSLDPRTATDSISSHVVRLFTQGLSYSDSRMLPVGDLAMSIASHKGYKYIFDLNPRARFSNGDLVTADDVIFSFQLYAEPGSKFSSHLANVESVKQEGQHRVVVSLRQPDAGFLSGEASGLRIISKQDYQLNGRKPEFLVLGSGPYYLSRRQGRDLIFKKNRHYSSHRNGKYLPSPFYETVVVRAVQDPGTRFLALRAGQVHLVVNALGPARLVEAAKTPRIKILRSPGNTFQYVGLNHRASLFADRRVRLAMSLALDREAIVRHKLLGNARPAETLLSPINFFHVPELKPSSFDPVRAQQLLKQAGAYGREFVLKTSADPDVVSVALVLKNYWEKIGLKVNLLPQEFGVFFGQVQNGEFDAFLLRWTGVIDPEILFQAFHSSNVPPGRNRGYYSNSSFDRSVEKARRAVDLDQRYRLYAQSQKILSEDLPVIPLWYPDNVAVMSDTLQGFELHPTGSWMTFLGSERSQRLER